MTPSRFNIRVYGILIQEGKVLITDEVRSGVKMTKFPGGGLEFGEGIAECLIREFKEELNIRISIKTLFYVNDFYQVSSFNKNEQLVSIYYLVSLDEVGVVIGIRPKGLLEVGFRRGKFLIPSFKIKIPFSNSLFLK